MKTWIVVLGVSGLAGVSHAEGPATKPGVLANSLAREAQKAREAAAAEAVAKEAGISLDDLKTLREHGFSDAEVRMQVRERGRDARQMILERQVLNDLARAVSETDSRVYRMANKADQVAERDRSLKAAVAKVRRDHHAGRDEVRKIVAGTSLFTQDELRRYLGPILFSTDDLKRVIFDAREDDSPFGK